MPGLGPTYNEEEITLVPLCFLRIFFSPLIFARPDTDHRAHILWRLELAFEIFMIFLLTSMVGKDAHPVAQYYKKIAVVTGKEFGILEEGRPRLSWAEFLKERSRNRRKIWDCGRVPWSRRNPSDFCERTPNLVGKYPDLAGWHSRRARLRLGRNLEWRKATKSRAFKWKNLRPKCRLRLRFFFLFFL